MNVKIGNKLDEAEFFDAYNLIMKRVEDISETEIVFDISECGWIENVVIPDILVMGEILKYKYRKKLVLFLPKHGKAIKRIKSYLNDIRFVDIAEWEDNIDVEYVVYDRDERAKRIIPDYCMTTSYKIEIENLSNEERKKKEERIVRQIEQDVLNNYMELFQKYLSQFFYAEAADDGNIPFNSIQVFIIQISINAIVHGHKKVFVTMQANIDEKLCTISVSDNGIGITEGIREKYRSGIRMSLVARDTFEKLKPFHQDIVSVIEALAYRYNDKLYGLYNIFLQVLDEQGEIHIHTNNALLLFKGSCINYLDNARNKDEFALGLYNYLIRNKKNAIRTKYFQGTHIKLLIPIKKE